MEITYRTKNNPLGIGIQVDFESTENLLPLITELIELGFTYKKPNVPPEFNKGKSTSYFYRDGSGMFGLKTIEELQIFVDDTAPILKRYDKKFKKSKCYLYDND
jgi:citrate lyase synthetase